MQCHYCDREAAIAVEQHALKVGLCEDHFRARLKELSEEGWLDDFEEQLGIDRR